MTRLVSTRAELREAAAALPGDRVGLVPTMGALHEGHASLLRLAREHADVTVASIFVNPLQFGPGEDLSRYPRTLESDLDLCAAHDVDLAFAPSVEEVYPGGEPQVTVEPGPLATILDGASRPGHFRGVLTVVAKLFNLVRPDVAVFGEKDYQQLTLIRRMVDDLCFDIRIVGGNTVREPDGLALSSRNRYLDGPQRLAALALSRALRAAQDRAAYGEQAAREAALRVLADEPGVDLDYLAITGADLGPAPQEGEARVLVAAKVGTTRLIDNLPLELGTQDTRDEGAA